MLLLELLAGRPDRRSDGRQQAEDTSPGQRTQDTESEQDRRQAQDNGPTRRRKEGKPRQTVDARHNEYA